MSDARNLKDDPSIGEKPMFSHFYLRQMRAEELYESLLLVTEAQKAKAKETEQQTAQGKVAQPVQRGLRHRRQRRGHHVQRHYRSKP